MTSTEPLFSYPLIKLHKTRAQSTFCKAAYVAQAIEETLLERCLSWMPNIQKVLILGCPGGKVRSFFANQKGVEVFYYDPLLEETFQEEGLPFRKGSLDLILEGFVFHWINDPLTYLKALKKLLKPGGVYSSGFLGERTLSEFRQVLLETDVFFFKGASPHVSPMIPAEAATRLLQAASFDCPVVDHEEFLGQYGSVKELIHDLRAMGETNALCERGPPRFQREYIPFMERTYRRLFPWQKTGVYATFDVIFMAGWVL